MVDDDFDGEDLTENDDDSENVTTMKVSDLKNLRRAANNASKNNAELAQAKKDLAFLRAGVDVDSAIGKLFTKAYDGDLDPAVIKEQAGEVGALITGTTPPVTETSEEGETQSTQERQNLANGAAGDENLEVDPIKASLDSARQNMKNGMSEEDAMAEFIDDRLYAASKGDPRVIIQPGTQTRPQS